MTAKDFTWDQKPDHPEERKRIVKMGGIVTEPESEGASLRVWAIHRQYGSPMPSNSKPSAGLSSRVWTHNGRYGLSMSRSIGDHLLSKNGVIADPEVRLGLLGL